MSKSATWIAQLFKGLNIDPADAKKGLDLLAEDELGKAQHAETTSDTREIPDRWQSGQTHKVPTSEQIKVGPSFGASGSSAERMTAHYSHPAPQEGVQLEAERLASEMGRLHKSMQIIGDTVTTQGEAIKALTEQSRKLTGVAAALLAKADKDEDEDEKEKKKVFELHTKKAQEDFAMAQKLAKKAKKTKDAFKAETDAAIKATLEQQYKLLRKAATAYIVRAQESALIAKSGEEDPTIETRKAITEFVDANRFIKANLSEAKNWDGPSLAKKAKDLVVTPPVEVKAEAEKPAEKAVSGDDKGMQADRQDPETKNQDDAAKAVADMASKVDDAMKGFGMLKTTVAGLMDTIAGKPINPDNVQPLTLMKGDPTVVAKSIQDKIERAVDDDTIDPAAEVRARDLLAKLTAVRSGAISEETFRSALRQSPHTVQQIFQEAA